MFATYCSGLQNTEILCILSEQLSFQSHQLLLLCQDHLHVCEVQGHLQCHFLKTHPKPCLPGDSVEHPEVVQAPPPRAASKDEKAGIKGGCAVEGSRAGTDGAIGALVSTALRTEPHRVLCKGKVGVSLGLNFQGGLIVT